MSLKITTDLATNH